MDQRGAALTDRTPDAAGRRRPNALPWPLVPTLAAAPVIGLALFYVWPFVTLVARGLTPSAIGDTLGNSLTWDVLWFTTWQALLSTVLTVLIGLPPAYVFARYRFAGRRLIDAGLAAMFVLPTVVMGAAMLALLPASLERGVVAILAAHVTFNLAVVVRTVGAVLAATPRDREGAAATLGASPWRAFVTVTLPALRPALFAAAAIVFVFTFTSFGVIRVVGTVRQSTLEVEIWRQATQFGDIGGAAVLTIVQLLVVAAAVAATNRLGRRRGAAGDQQQRRAVRVDEQRRRPQNSRQRRFVAIVVAVTGAIVGAPLFALAARSVRGSDGFSLTAWRTLSRSEVRPGISSGIDPLASLGVSLRTAVVAAAIAVVIGALASLAIATARRGGRLLDLGLALPLATSAITVGFGMLITFDHDPVDWRGSAWILPVGHALVAIPFVVRTVGPVLSGVDRRRFDAAATLGATPLRAWATVLLPHLRRPLAVAGGISVAISLGEFGATSFLSRSGRETMPIAIEQLLGRPGAALQAQGYALATMLAVATIAAVAVVGALEVERK